MSDNPCLDCEAVCCSFRESRVGYLALGPGRRYDSAMIESVEANPDSLLLETGEPMDARWFVWDPRGRLDTDQREVFFVCSHLTEDGLCGVYEDRPGMCRAFECAVLEGESTLEEWHEEKGWDGPPEDEVTEVTERVNEIIERQT